MYQGNKLALTRLDNDLVELHFNAADGSVNKFDSDTVAELEEAIAQLEKSDGIRGLLVTSGKSVFIAGADITEFGAIFGSDHDKFRRFAAPNNRNILHLEHLAFPVVVAINGAAMGGGLEFCLGCDYRVMSSKAQVGLPETGLGIMPGWGGTVRLPRIIGFEEAAAAVASGAPYKADKALKVGMVDAVVEPEHLRDESLALLKRCVSGELDYQSRRLAKHDPIGHNPVEYEMAVTTTRAQVKQLAGRHWKAPLTAFESMVKSAPLPKSEALEVEYEAFFETTHTAEARAMVGVFLNDQAINKTARQFAKQARKVERVAVLGAGVMGGGIAYQNAAKGFPVLMKDINSEALDLGMREANGLVSKRIERGQLDARKGGEVLTRITPTLEYSGIEQTQMVIEAVVENLDIKRSVLAEAEELVDSETVLASNTSTLSVSKLAAGLKRPENFCGMHFFNPVHAMPLVEVVRGKQTGAVTVATAVAQALAMGKKAIVVADCPAFFVNRTLFPSIFAFDMLVREGVDFQQIDRAVEDWGMPMGPAYLMDVVGIDVAVHCLPSLEEGYPDRMALDRDQSALCLMATHKRYGQKSGAGFYAYEAGQGRPGKSADDATYTLIANHITREQKSLEAEDIALRVMLPMALEAARALEEGVVASPAEGDMALLYGLGFPRFRGGVYRWMDEVGLAEICRLADRFSALGKLYEPTDKMRAMAAHGERYYA